ncbi:MAG: HlyD family efflux transporter periplasmic adaptor subunit [Crocinitomicaceae bacterium]|nr:HlyD family efflux transporter periplasmic adaptor subunit [Crocinitomicaceae bacterium]
MLNISKHSISKKVRSKKYSSLIMVEQKKAPPALKRILKWSLFLTFAILLLPWTQNIRSYGNVTTLKPNQKPQSLNSVIAGQIKRWYVQEGDFVRKGDTILQISEVKSDYFDERLLERTEDQLKFKKESIGAYNDKIKTQEERLAILNNQRDLKISQSRVKLQQAELKVQNNQIAFEAAKVQYQTAKDRLERMDSLYLAGLKSLTDLESRKIKVQEAASYETAAKNKLLNSESELISLQLEISNVDAYYQSEINKVRSDRLSTISTRLDSETNVSKLENQYSNYVYRQGLYFILAPTDGYITKTNASGIGETIKEGEEILSLMPKSYDLAVEIYIDPIDLPLVKKGEHVRLQFDGWPAIVFSGWPNASQGTYGGIIYGIDQFISKNGKYRILIQQDPKDHPWPDALRFGGGTSSMILLNDVPIWYELWRKINGFPPNYYTGKDTQEAEAKAKQKMH